MVCGLAKTRTTIVLQYCAEILNQEEKQKLFFSLLCYTAKEERKGRLGFEENFVTQKFCSDCLTCAEICSLQKPLMLLHITAAN